jgi:hypothetical protein
MLAIEDCEKVARIELSRPTGGGVRCKPRCNVAIGRLQLCRAHGEILLAGIFKRLPPVDDEDDGDGLMHLGMGSPAEYEHGEMAIDHP